MAIVRVNPNLEAEVTGSAFSNGPLERTLGDAASDIALVAKAIARVDFYDRGGYLRGIKAEHGLDERGELVGRVVATKYTSHWAEFGWKRRVGGTRARHILQRAAEAVGYQVFISGAFGSGGFGPSALPGARRQAITSR